MELSAFMGSVGYWKWFADCPENLSAALYMTLHETLTDKDNYVHVGGGGGGGGRGGTKMIEVWS